MDSSRPKPLNVFELYAGTARSAEPFRRSSAFRIRLLVDNSSFAFETYLANYPDAPYLVRSVAHLTAADAVSIAGCKPDVLLGCPPCQGLSEAGLRNPRDRRNRHLTHFADFALALRPKAIAFENVPRAANAVRFARFVERLQDAGYLCEWGVVNSAHYGSAQLRERALLVAVRADAGSAPVFPRPTHGSGHVYSYRLGRVVSADTPGAEIFARSPVLNRIGAPYVAPGPKATSTVERALRGLPRVGSRAAGLLSHVPWSHSKLVLQRMRRVPEGGRWEGGAEHYSHAYGRLHRRGLARTLTTYFPNAGSGRFWHPVANRALTLREAARLQGFPDAFLFFNTGHSAKLIGNALDASFAEIVFSIICASLDRKT